VSKEKTEKPTINKAAARHLLGQIRADIVEARLELERGSLTVANRILTGVCKLRYVLRMNEAHADVAEEADKLITPIVADVAAEELRRSRL